MLVCRQAPPGLEVIVGGLQDAIFGPALMFGLGGIFAEVLEDVTFRIAPIGPGDAKEMIQEIRGYPLLAGTRGQVGYDVEALADLLLAVSRMMAERVEIQELDLNPVRVYEQGLLALDARILLAADQQGVQ
jgi:acyl-CoA synthetase (NDP forming)